MRECHICPYQVQGQLWVYIKKAAPFRIGTLIVPLLEGLRWLLQRQMQLKPPPHGESISAFASSPHFSVVAAGIGNLAVQVFCFSVLFGVCEG